MFFLDSGFKHYSFVKYVLVGTCVFTATAFSELAALRSVITGNGYVWLGGTRTSAGAPYTNQDGSILNWFAWQGGKLLYET